MNLVAVTGIGMILLSLAYLADIARRKGAAFEIAGALFHGELGLMLTVNGLLPKSPVTLATTVALGVSMGVSAWMWRRLYREFRKSHLPNTSS